MESTNLGRRAFLRGRSQKIKPAAIYPPWAIESSLFTQQCERCDDCIKQCPEGIITRGDGGFPEVNFRLGECTFCAECADVCKADAFVKGKNKGDLNENNAWPLFVEVASNCLSMNAIMCRTCGDSCDENAITFKLQIGGISIPLVDSEACTGCGACIYACPENSISVVRNDDNRSG